MEFDTMGSPARRTPAAGAQPIAMELLGWGIFNQT